MIQTAGAVTRPVATSLLRRWVALGFEFILELSPVFCEQGLQECL
ncbi:hypothetical protein FM113_01325 [Leucobacter sp. 7(1)]|nr:hypothetical protein FM113_01325 [Leucobacter sp. 7(1)]